MEAALRTAVETLTGKELANLDFTEVRGVEGIKEATYTVAGMDIHVAVASGLANARKLLDDIKAGKSNYHFIEFMGCPGGCVTGGGQPIQPAKVTMGIDLKAERAKAIYDEDESLTLRKSHENPFIKKLYDEFLEHPLSEKAVKLLHTDYVARELYPSEPSLYKPNNK
jgi:NADP-reducing hydrogenase subunit HndD